MAEFRWIIMSSFVMLLFNFKGAAGDSSIVAVRVGDEATLPCDNMKPVQDKCGGITWEFNDSGEFVTLFDRGQIHKDAATKSDRLSVTEQCSLVIKNVTVEDAHAYYVCKQIRSEEFVVVFLSVVSITEQKNNDTVSLLCSVTYIGWCVYSVKWLHEGNNVTDKIASQDVCSARMTFTTSDFSQKSKNDSLKCEVINPNSGKVYLFPFSPPQSSGDDATTTITRTSLEFSAAEETNINDGRKQQQGWWKIIFVPLGLAALIITVVAVNMWRRTKGNRAQMEENIQRNDEDEDEGTVHYENVGEHSASIRLH